MEQQSDKVEQQSYQVEEESYKIGEILSKAWKYTKEHLGFFIGYLMIMAIITLLFSGVADALSKQGRQFLAFLIHLSGWVVSTFMNMGLAKSALLITSGVKPGFNQLYCNDRYFFSYFASTIIFNIMIILGLILLIVPGLYLLSKYFFYSYFVLDKNLGPIESLEAAGKASEGKKWFLFLLLITYLLLNVAGALLLGIGLLITIPMSVLACAIVYRKLTHTENEVTLIT